MTPEAKGLSVLHGLELTYRIKCAVGRHINLVLAQFMAAGDCGDGRSQQACCRCPARKASTMLSRCSTTHRWQTRAPRLTARPRLRRAPISRHHTTCGARPRPLNRPPCPCCMSCAKAAACPASGPGVVHGASMLQGRGSVSSCRLARPGNCTTGILRWPHSK